MYKFLATSAISLLSVAGAAQAASQINQATVSGGGAATVLSAAPIHSAGPGAIAQVAVEISGDGGVWSFPNLNDSGDAGDASANDGVWSLSVDLSAAPAGSYDAVFYVIDQNGEETVADPISFEVQ